LTIPRDGGDETVSEETKHKAVLDEEMFTRLLEAAYVLQEHNRELKAMELQLEPQQLAVEQEAVFPTPVNGQPEAAPAPKDYTFTLGQIVETQHQIQVRHLELDNAMSLVAERVTEIAKAGGAAIGMLDGRKVRYHAASGLMTLAAGTEVPMEKALCVACLRTGQVIRCADVNPEFLLDSEECHRRGIQSLIAVPVYHDGGIAGGLEVYYDSTQSFSEQDVHTCQLMAGLITEALARNEEITWKRSLAGERAAMLEALEKLKPKLANLANAPSGAESAEWEESPTEPLQDPAFVCLVCGNELMGQEQFCGKCGSPRGEAHVASHPVQPISSPAGLETGTPGTDLDEGRPEMSLADALEAELPHLFASEETTDLALRENEGAPINDAVGESGLPALIEGSAKEDVPNTKLAKPDLGAWTSAATARAFLEQLAPAGKQSAFSRFWHARRGDFYLAIAVILVAGVIRWGIWSDGSVSATGNGTPSASNRKPNPDADLSLFDRMLITFGLAEAQPVPQENKGNPDIAVWVDLRTALYYCPGAELYGKTPKGKFTTQREAQLDQFEPGSRKACE